MIHSIKLVLSWLRSVLPHIIRIQPFARLYLLYILLFVFKNIPLAPLPSNEEAVTETFVKPDCPVKELAEPEFDYQHQLIRKETECITVPFSSSLRSFVCVSKASLEYEVFPFDISSVTLWFINPVISCVPS